MQVLRAYHFSTGVVSLAGSTQSIVNNNLPLYSPCTVSGLTLSSIRHCLITLSGARHEPAIPFEN